MRNTTRRWAAGLALGLGLGFGAVRGDEPRLAETYGFLPLEIYKLDTRISSLNAGDIDGDGIDDVIVANNARSRIDFLLSTKGPTEDEGKTEANLVRSDQRMRLKSLPVNDEVVSLQTGDFNGDGKVDLAYYGTPAKLVVLLNEGKAQFASPRRFTTGDAVESAVALAVGDLNRDGKDDLALLTSSDVVTLIQKDGKLGEPQRLPHTGSNPTMLRLVDLDGDGGDDLVIVDRGEDPIRVRFSTEGGKLGPEQRFHVENPRAVAYGQIDGKPGEELLTIENSTGRAKAFTLSESDEDEFGKRGRLIFFPLPKGDTRGRSLASADLDGDGKLDVVVTDPADAQFLVYLQGKSGLGSGQTFPGLAGGKSVAAADFDGDKKAEILVLSESEKQIGLTRLEDGKIGFPTPLPLDGDPVAMTVSNLDKKDSTPEILYITAGKDGSDSYLLKGLKAEKGGKFTPLRWGQVESVPIKGLSGKPPALQVMDANKDGMPDILVFNAYGPPVLLLGREGEPPAPASGTLGPLVGATPTGLSLSPFDGGAIFVAQQTFARNVALEKSGQWQIREQFNSGKPSAQIQGAAALDLDGDGVPEIALMDKSLRSLLFLEKKAGNVYKPNGTLNVGPIDFQGLITGDYNGDGKDDLLIAGTDKFGVVLTGSKGLRFKLLSSYEPTRKDAKLGDLIVGDVNGDGQPDVVVTDLEDHLIDLLTAAKNGADLDRALTFKVFEKKSSRDRDSMVEPRDLMLGDVNGDKKTDLILMVHDRILIYRQDTGQAKPEKTADAK